MRDRTSKSSTIEEAATATADLRIRADEAPSTEVQDLTKTFGDVAAVAGLSFSVQPGEVFALLGTNGAGQSTTINILCTSALATSGRARVAGFGEVHCPNHVRHHIDLVFQDQTLDVQLTAEENLQSYPVPYGVPKSVRAERIEHVLELVKLAAVVRTDPRDVSDRG